MSDFKKNIQEAKARQQREIQKADAKKNTLEVQLAAQQKPATSAAIDQPQPRQQQQQAQQEMLPDSIDRFANLFEIVNHAQYDVSREPTEIPMRTINAGAGARAPKRQRTERDLQHLTLDEQESVADIDSTKLPNVDAAWKALDWAYGLYQKNAGDINNPQDALEQVITNHSKESASQQKTLPLEDWLMAVLIKLGAENAALCTHLIFTKLTGRGPYAYSLLIRKHKKIT